jgi:hypothetical protein
MWQPPVGGFWPLQRQVRKEGLGCPGGAADPENPPVRSGVTAYVVGSIRSGILSILHCSYSIINLISFQLLDRDLIAQIQ